MMANARQALGATLVLGVIVALAPHFGSVAATWVDSSPEANASPAPSLADIEQSLLRRNEALELALADALAPARPLDSALAPRLVSARLLGRLARRYLPLDDLLGAGSDESVAVESLVLADAAPTLVDRGANHSVAAEQLLLVGRSVWGKVIEVGPRTSRARRITDRQYRDVVQLAQLEDDRVRHGARGLLEGDGNGGCRVRLVETTHPVSAGDWVLAVGLQGLTHVPIVYGRVTRAERQTGSAHWDIDVAPSATVDTPFVAILIGEPTTSGEIVR